MVDPTLTESGVRSLRADFADGGRTGLRIRVLATPDPRWADAFLPADRAVLRIGRSPDAPETARIAIADTRMSRLHATLKRGEDGGLKLTDEGSRNGTYINGLSLSASSAVTDGDLLRLGKTLLAVERDGGPGEEREGLGLLGRSPEVRALRELIRRGGPSHLPFLITGPTGAGKELVARAAHAVSGRRGKMVSINCAAVPSTLIENTLFGHTRGAYTDAKRESRGVFREADGGTVFLDEVGELPLDAQAKLLRTLENGEVTPVGAAVPVIVDVRIVAATNRDLASCVRNGTFRADLYARINGVPVEVPSLEDRKQDVLRLFQHFVGSEFASREMSADTAEALLVWSWPHNIRELKLLAERLCVLHPDAERWIICPKRWCARCWSAMSISRPSKKSRACRPRPRVKSWSRYWLAAVGMCGGLRPLPGVTGGRFIAG